MHSMNMYFTNETFMIQAKKPSSWTAGFTTDHTHLQLVVILEGHGTGQCHAPSTGEVGHGGAEEGVVPRWEVQVFQQEVLEVQREGVTRGGARRRSREIGPVQP